MSIMDQLKEKAKLAKQRIVLPEGTEPRTLNAVKVIAGEGLADLIMLGDEATIQAEMKDFPQVRIIDPKSSPLFDEYANTYYEMRKEKGMTPEKARETMKDVLFFGTMLLKKGEADGMVAGAINTTGNTLRPGLQIIKTLPGISIVSSCFLMICPNQKYGENGVLLFGDCAVNPNPNPDELAAIAISTARTGKALIGMEPRVALLSFSTKGSAKHELVDKVTDALAIIKNQAPDLLCDGELQADAALVESVAKLKSPGSPVAGKANILIFPDLQSGNIGYKLVQRLAGAEAIGPIIQGMAKPVNDLSRGCSAEDIVNVVAITALQAKALQK
ncbi:MAG: phosphate acetyltransferase [Christensenellales bacterium]